MQTNENNSKKSGNFFVDTFIPTKTDSKEVKTRKLITDIVTLVIIAILVVGCIFLFTKGGSEEPSSSIQQSSEVSSDESSEEEEPPQLEVNLDPETGVWTEFSEEYKENSDLIGRISIEGTKLTEPVVKAADNAYYLNRSFAKEYEPYGVPFADFRAVVAPDFQSDNITIYGHSGKNDTLFAPVKQYNDIEFYKEHPTVIFDTIFGAGEYKVIGRFIEYVDLSNKDMFNYHDYVNFEDEAKFNEFVDNVKKRSYFDAPVDVEFGDKFITLSTCNVEIVDSNTTPYRDVLVARKVRPGEDITVDVSKATINKDMIMPSGWVKKFGKNNPYA